MFLRGICLLICSAVAVSAIGDHPDVTQLTSSNWDDAVSNTPLMLIEFYAPWCGHCKRLAPEYEKAAERLAKGDPQIPLAKVDCTEEESICSKHGVSGYPTLKIFKDGEVAKDYDGPRDADGIVRTMNVEGGPASKEISSLSDFNKFIDHFDHSVVGFFSDPESAQAKAFLKVAGQMKADLRFAHTAAEEILKEFEEHRDDVVVFRPKRLLTKLEENKFECEEKKTAPAIRTCVEKNLHGLVGHRSLSNVAFFKQPLVNVYYGVDYVKNPKGSNYWRNRVIKVAKEYSDDNKVNFAVSSWEEFANELEEFGQKPGSADSKPIVTAKDVKGQKYVMQEEFSPDNINRFVESFLSNKLEPYMKSEDIPEQVAGQATVLVAKNFNDLVTDEQDALLEFYAPWCGHCKKLAPVYDELASKLENDNVVIGKMDATANDVPADYNVRGFPTLYWKKAGAAPVPYDGGRELDDFIKYIAKHSTDELKSYTRSGKKRKASKSKEEL